VIIWGSKVKEGFVKTGEFFCPKCLRESPYSHYRIAKYFTLYFIPLFVTETLGEIVHCHTCNTNLSIEALWCDREELIKAAQPWACWSCKVENHGSRTSCKACNAPR
jgi:hypothetical protein